MAPARHAHAAVAAACAMAEEEPKRVVTAVRPAVAAVRPKRRVKERERGTCVPGSVDAVWTIWMRHREGGGNKGEGGGQ